jgi:hypothetical protein
MEALSLLRVVVIRSTKKTNGIAVMKEAMQFRDIKLVAYTELEKDVFISVEV